jgi:type III restriction enzyme
MKLRFKVQGYQTDAVDAVVDCFAGQPRDAGPHDVGPGDGTDPGRRSPESPAADPGLRNARIQLSPAQLLRNVQAVQLGRHLPLSRALVSSRAAGTPDTPNLDVEMETGTGKTYVYIKTIMELNKRYGWSRFVVVVPSVAIREGVRKTFEVTAEHFQESYGTRPRTFVYDSSQLHELERFSSDAGVQVMIINIQAFNSTGRENRRIYDVLDDFQSRRPIDVISASRPIVIIDEPQKIGAPKSLHALSRLDALLLLRYSATHTVEHNKVFRLDALDAYNQKLVKRIAVRGITVTGLSGSSAYLYLDGIEIAPGSEPRARVELEVRTSSGISRQTRRLRAGANLYEVSGGIEAYRGLLVTDIDAGRDVVELSNGDVVAAGQVTADVTEQAKRRIQIREVIRAHLDKERELFGRGIKVLSLFFIDEVAKYRTYERKDALGDYARMFTEEYRALVDDELSRPVPDAGAAEYRTHLASIAVADTHRGYFSIDKRTRRLVDGEVRKTGAEQGQSADADAYDLILRDKERLLSFAEPVRFVFSHSALREGWDNPNVFVMGMLKKSDNTVSRRQEIGRGLRLAVDQRGERVDDPVTVHDINELTVVTDESYTDFVAGLQREIGESLAGRPRTASAADYVVTDGRRPRRGFREPPRRTDHRADRPVLFDSGELVDACVAALDARLTVAALQYVVEQGTQRGAVDPGHLAQGAGFTPGSAGSSTAGAWTASRVEYDLLGEITARTTLTRRTVAAILGAVRPGTFAKYRQNPEQFITEAARLINERKAAAVLRDAQPE